MNLEKSYTIKYVEFHLVLQSSIADFNFKDAIAPRNVGVRSFSTNLRHFIIKFSVSAQLLIDFVTTRCRQWAAQFTQFWYSASNSATDFSIFSPLSVVTPNIWCSDIPNSSRFPLMMCIRCSLCALYYMHANCMHDDIAVHNVRHIHSQNCTVIPRRNLYHQRNDLVFNLRWYLLSNFCSARSNVFFDVLSGYLQFNALWSKRYLVWL